MNELDKLRQKIDSLDRELLRLLNARAKQAEAIGKLKLGKGQAIFVPGRERVLLEKIKKNNAGPLPNSSVQDVFREVLHACRGVQKQLQIAFFGLHATNTHTAAVKNFGRQAVYIPCSTIADVFEAVEKGQVDYGVVPIENSTEGVVTHTLDMFIHSDLQICAESELPIQHLLLAHPKANFETRKPTKIVSHPQALAQCRKWLETHWPGVPTEQALSTAHAAQLVQKNPTWLAIATTLAAELYGLRVMAESIEDESNNTTRFFVIGRQETQPSGKDKTSILFSIKDRVGALYETLLPFRKYGLNMTKIESRPTRRKLWEYVFFVDFLGHRSERNVQRVLQELERSCVFVKVLGSYPRLER